MGGMIVGITTTVGIIGGIMVEMIAVTTEVILMITLDIITATPTIVEEITAKILGKITTKVSVKLRAKIMVGPIPAITPTMVITETRVQTVAAQTVAAQVPQIADHPLN